MPARVRSAMKKPFVIDARNMLDADHLAGLGFIYSGVGRGD